jgi:predicted amidohydrolase
VSGDLLQMICFDMEFGQPARQLLAESVDAVLVSSLWENDPPLFEAIMFQQAW